MQSPAAHISRTPHYFHVPEQATAELRKVAENPFTAPAMALLDADPHLNVIVVNFDGTCNLGEEASDNEYDTFIYRRHKHLEALGNPIKNPRFCSTYQAGVYTKKGVAKAVIEGRLGAGVLTRADDSIKNVEAFMKMRRTVDLNARFHVHIAAFSRGCASALILANRLSDMSAREPVTASGLLLDAVTTGVATTAGNIANRISKWEGSVAEDDLRLPPQPWPFLHLCAGGETRTLFPLHSLSEKGVSEAVQARGLYMAGAADADLTSEFYRLVEVKLHALSHGDVGGTYPGSTGREIVEYEALVFEQSLGIPVRPVKPSEDVMANPVAAHWDGGHMAGDWVLKRLKTTDRTGINRFEQVAFKAWDAMPTNLHQRFWDGIRKIGRVLISNSVSPQVLQLKDLSHRNLNKMTKRAVAITTPVLRGIHGPNAQAAFEKMVHDSKPLAPPKLRFATQKCWRRPDIEPVL